MLRPSLLAARACCQVAAASSKLCADLPAAYGRLSEAAAAKKQAGDLPAALEEMKAALKLVL